MEITVNVTGVDLDSVVGEEGVRYDGDGDLAPGGPITLRAAVVREVARQLVEEHGKSYELGRVVGEIRGDLIREALAPVVQAALDKPVQRTNGFGEVQGEPTSMRLLLVDEARKLLNARVDSSGRPTQYQGDQKSTYVRWLVADMVREAFGAELKAELDAAKAELRATLQQVAAAKLAEAVKV